MLAAPVVPRFNVMLLYLRGPGILRTVASSLLLRYSMTATSTPSPLTSAKEPLTARPSSLIPLTSTSNLQAGQGSSR
jgi:hypothetical protein